MNNTSWTNEIPQISSGGFTQFKSFYVKFLGFSGMYCLKLGRLFHKVRDSSALTSFGGRYAYGQFFSFTPAFPVGLSFEI